MTKFTKNDFTEDESDESSGESEKESVKESTGKSVKKPAKGQHPVEKDETKIDEEPLNKTEHGNITTVGEGCMISGAIIATGPVYIKGGCGGVTSKKDIVIYESGAVVGDVSSEENVTIHGGNK